MTKIVVSGCLLGFPCRYDGKDCYLEKIEELKTKSEMFENVSFSAGWSCLTCNRNIRQSLAEADSRMYEDKEEFYRQHPEKMRK